MRTRLLLVTAALGVLALALPSAVAAPPPPTLDGKTVKKLSITAKSDLQNNADNPVPESCVAPRCAMLPFVYNPAKGVKGDILFTLNWTSPVSDLDLYVAEVGKSSNTQVLSCGTFTTVKNQEKIFAPAGTLKKGKTYALVIDFYRSNSDTATGTLEMPGKDSTVTTIPSNADRLKINCGM